MIQNFTKGVSITELSIELWFLINDIDIATPLGPNGEDPASHLSPIPEQAEEFKDFDKVSVLSMPSVVDNYQSPYEEYLPDRRFKRQVAIASKLQFLVSRLCGIFDEILVLEKIRLRNDVTPMFRNMLEYSYHSHLVLCTVVLDRVPDSTKQENVSRFKNV